MLSYLFAVAAGAFVAYAQEKGWWKEIGEDFKKKDDK